MYEKPTVLNSVTNKNLKVAPIKDLSFTKDLNSCVVLCQEFPEAAKNCPIIFSSNGETIIPIMMLGIKSNSFVNEDGKWQDGAYIPAFIRRYPYILAEGLSADGSLTVCVDSEYPGLDAEGGERLFNDEGGNTELLNNVLDFLRLYHDHYEGTKAFVSHLKGLNLFKPVDANITMAGSGEQFTIKNLLMVDEAAMLKLSDGELVEMTKRGYLAWIYAHLFSMNNFTKIMK